MDQILYVFMWLNLSSMTAQPLELFTSREICVREVQIYQAKLDRGEFAGDRFKPYCREYHPGKKFSE